MALIDTHKAVKQFTTAGIPEKQAEAITEVISNIDQQVATKSDIARLESKIILSAGIPGTQVEAITEVISNIDQQVATKSDIARLESKIDMVNNKFDIHMKWIMGIGGAMFLMLVKLTFFNS